jgi:hypothetical protein
MRQLAWPCIVAGLIIALSWPIYVEGVRSNALVQASLLILRAEPSTVALANQVVLDRDAVLKAFRDAHALSIPPGVALGAALAFLGAFVVTRRSAEAGVPKTIIPKRVFDESLAGSYAALIPWLRCTLSHRPYWRQDDDEDQMIYWRQCQECWRRWSA